MANRKRKKPKTDGWSSLFTRAREINLLIELLEKLREILEGYF
jgi:hypothetical protein